MSKKLIGSNNLIVQGSILAIASLIVRLIGLLYRIPLVNILGIEGSGYYASAYTIYTFLLIISSYGLPAAISKIIAKRMTIKKYKEAHIIFKSSLVFAVIIGAAFSGILYFGAEWYSNFIEIPKAKIAIQGLAPALFIFSFMSVFRGYYQGMNTMVPTAISQIIEQVFNAIFSLVIAMLLLQRGVEYAAAGSSIGTGMGAFFGTVFLVIVYFMMRPKIHERCQKDTNTIESGNITFYWKLLLMTSIPMLIGSTAFHVTNLVDGIMFNKALAFHQYSALQIASLSGLFEGKYKILITLPVSIAAAMATASIPSITKSLVLNDHTVVVKKVDLAIRSVLMVSIPAMVGVFVLARPILELLFKDMSYIDVTVNILKLGSITIVLFGVSTISIGLLQGLGLLNIPVKNSLISLVIKVLFNILFLYVLDTNLYGAVITNIIFAAISGYLNFRAVRQYLSLKINIYKTIVAPSIASAIMGVVTFVVYTLLAIVIAPKLSTVLVLPVAMIVYLIALLKLKTFDADELNAIPFGSKLKRFL
jgi:stage V sporulation protein B